MGLNSKPFYWRARKAWYIHVIGENGKRSARKLADKRKAAFEEYDKLLLAAKATVEAEVLDDPLFEDVSDAWLERQDQRLEQGVISAKWLERACSTIVRWNNANPSIRVSQITPAKVQSWLVKPSANYERTELSLLRQVLNWARKSAKLIRENPLEGLELPGMTRREGTLTLQQHANVLAAAKHLRPLLEVAWLTGSRPGELRELKWSQLSEDLSEAMLLTHKTKKRTARPRRIIFPSEAQKVLSNQKKSSAYVFLNSRGLPWSSNAVAQAVKKIRTKTGLSLVAGTYRHTFATNALERGVEIATVSQLLGHSSTAMVSRVYGHLADRVDHLKTAAQIASDGALPEAEKPPSKADADAKQVREEGA